VRGRSEPGYRAGWRDGGMEGWRDGGMEGWRDGGMMMTIECYCHSTVSTCRRRSLHWALFSATNVTDPSSFLFGSQICIEVDVSLSKFGQFRVYQIPRQNAWGTSYSVSLYTNRPWSVRTAAHGSRLTSTFVTPPRQRAQQLRPLELITLPSG
jgi:hypothetical protein